MTADEVEGYTFRDIRVAPTFAELSSLRRNFLRPNITEGPFPNVESYLDTHFRLYREDFVRPLQAGVQELLGNLNKYLVAKKKDLPNTVYIYKNVRFDCVLDKKGRPKRDQFIVLQPCDYEGVDWEKSDNFRPNSLIIITLNNFREAYVGVINRDEEELQRGILGVRFFDVPPVTNGVKEVLVVESKQYFGAYWKTLEILQNLKPRKFPFKSFIVDVLSGIKPPQYLLKNSAPVYLGNTSVELLNPETWPSHVHLDLNPRQFEALKACLTQELAIIQGPPGTGKTFMALKVMEVYLRNYNFWNPASDGHAPILVVCYTNYALDQFLEGVLGIFKRIGEFPRMIRVGNRSESAALEPYKLSILQNVTKKSAEKLVKGALVIGMTTTGAANYRHLLRAAKPRIVFVEEAAEVVECHLIPCLLPAAQHLILIGDHKQLRPCITVNELVNKYKLDVSLFERLVNNRLNLCTLNVQHRMRPEIAALLVGPIYSQLLPAPNVHEYPDVLGMACNVFFLNHSQPESLFAGSMSKSNKYEAEFLTALSRYIVQQGYKPSQITVLATYAGQVTVLQENLNRIESCKEIEVMTVDGFQGKENDIIILSLVRSNDEAKIGFLQKDNRICVGLSRARIGLFVAGDIDLLSSKSRTWLSIYKKLKNRGEVGKAMRIKCQRHGKNRDVKCAADFKLFAPDGGCTKPCHAIMACGHHCPLRCHPRDLDHETYCCNFPCNKTCNNGHSCKGLCYENCPPCLIKLDVKLLCGHSNVVQCCVTQNEEEMRMHAAHCLQECGYRFDEEDGGCGHICKGKCSSCAQGRFHVKCEQVCYRSLPCGHLCTSECWKPCPPCEMNCSVVDARVDVIELRKNITQSICNAKPTVKKYFPYVVFYQEKKLGPEEEVGPAELDSLGRLNDYLKQAVVTLSEKSSVSLTPELQSELIHRFYELFYDFIKRGIPWSTREVEDFHREFRRLEHLAIVYYLRMETDGKTGLFVRLMIEHLGRPVPYDKNAEDEFAALLSEYANFKKNSNSPTID